MCQPASCSPVLNLSSHHSLQCVTPSRPDMTDMHSQSQHDYVSVHFAGQENGNYNNSKQWRRTSCWRVSKLCLWAAFKSVFPSSCGFPLVFCFLQCWLWLQLLVSIPDTWQIIFQSEKRMHNLLLTVMLISSCASNELFSTLSFMLMRL